MTAPLTDLEQQLLAFEGLWWRQHGAKEAVVRERFGWLPTEHYRRLNLLLDEPAALAIQPSTVLRLRRLREQRARRRRAL